MAKSLKLSERAASMPASPIRKLVPLADEAKKQGKHVYHLNIGQPDIPTPGPFLEALRNFEHEVVAYGYSEGEHFLLDAFGDYYRRFGIETERGQIAVTTAGSEAILFSLLITCDPDDEVIVFEPFYTNYNGFAKAAAVKLVPIECKIDTGYHPPALEEIEKHITDKTRAIIICSPNNPTGAVFAREEMQVFGDLAKKHNLFIISDEVYREFVYDGLEHTSIMDLDGIDDRAIIADSISKRYSACGARIGCIVCKNKDVMTAALRFGQARLCPPIIEQYAVAAALRQPPEEYVIPAIEEYRKRRDIVYDAITEIPGVEVKRPEGAFYMAPRLPVDNAENFVTWMLTDFSYENSTVMLAPANGFYASPNKGVDEVRIAYVLNCDKLTHAMQVLKKALNAYPGRK